MPARDPGSTHVPSARITSELAASEARLTRQLGRMVPPSAMSTADARR